MPFFILSLIFQVALVVHIVKTGRNTTWIWIVVMLPLAGSIAYLLIEVLPGLGQSHKGRRAVHKVSSVLNPNRDLNQAMNAMERSDTIDNKMKLAGELLNKQQFSEARDIYQRCLSGLYQTDPYIMLGLAKAQFGCEQAAEAKSTLEQLIEFNPEFKDASGHLLYARCLETTGDTEAACHEYDALRDYYAGPEAKYRYALLCIQLNKRQLASELLNDILVDARNGGRLYNTMHKDWIVKTKSQLAMLKV